MDHHKPLFTLQQQHHTSNRLFTNQTKSNIGTNGVSSLTFLSVPQRVSTGTSYSSNDFANEEEEGSYNDSDYDDDEDDDVPTFRCRSILMNQHKQQLQNNSEEAINQATTISFAKSSIYLASCHINGEAHIWDLNKRQIAFSIVSSSSSSSSISGTCSSSNTEENESRGSYGPGLTLLHTFDYENNIESNNILPSSSSSSSKLLYQTRDEKGTISIHKLSSNTMDGCRLENIIHCHSRTFCQMTCGGGGGGGGCSSNSRGCGPNEYPYLIATPSKHESIVSLWDIRCTNSTSTSSTSSKPIGIVHGAGLDLKLNSNSSDWRKDGMVMSIKLCDWGGTFGDNEGGSTSSSSENSSFALGCGMESGNLYIHDIRKLNNSNGPVQKKEQHQQQSNDNTRNYDNESAIVTNEKDEVGRKHRVGKKNEESFDFVSSHYRSIQLGLNPIMTLDMLPSPSTTTTTVRSSLSSSRSIHEEIITANESNNKQLSSSSLITIAGTAGDANDQFDLPENERGTVNVIKVTKLDRTLSPSSLLQHNEYSCQINARIRAKVGTCKIEKEKNNNNNDDDVNKSSTTTFYGKPGVSICKLNPQDGSTFAVGGWDRRVRIYSRTNAKLLNVLRGSNEESISALDWVSNDIDLMNCGVLAAGSGDGKIMVWRTK